MLLSLLPLALGLSLLVLLASPTIRYLLNRNGLRSFPAPSFAGISSLWRIWHNLHYNHYLAVHDAHKKLGSHVRIGPNHLSVLDTQAPYEIYGHGANMMKEGFYDAAAGTHRNLADARDKYQHQAKRKMLAHVFAQKTVLTLEPVLLEMIQNMVEAIDKHVESGESMNIRRYLNYFTIDLLGMLLFSKQMGCVTRGDDMVDAETKEGVVYKTPFLQSLHNSTVLSIAFGMEPSMLPTLRFLFQKHAFTKDGQNWENFVYHHTKTRLEQKSEKNDIFTRLLQDSKGNSLNMPFGELSAECNVMMNAGTDTTTAAMTSTVFLLYTHPDILSKLRQELEPLFAGGGLASYSEVGNSPYLRACMEEALRVRPPSSMGLPRTVPEGGRIIAGKYVAGGVTVSVPTYSLLRDESIIDRPNEYIPERWLTDDVDEKKELMKNHLPFSTGPRACIGRNIAYFEQTLVIATIVHYFDLEIPAGFQLETQERFNSNPGDLFVKCTRRVLKG